ncbi:MAG: hypothetical protein ACRDT6_05515 [Micromonosporaceae bacterium]
MYLAHGIGGRSDLPVPLWIAAYGAAFAVIVSFLALVWLWREPRLTGAAAGRPLTGWGRAVADAPATRITLRVIGLLLFVATLATAWFGTDQVTTNPAPTWLYVWLWVGLVPLSVLFGPVWRRLNPLRTIAAAISGLGVKPRPLPQAVGYWPAVVSVLVFVWIELVYRSAASPMTVAVFVTGYALVHVTGGVVYGQRWFDKGDGFEAYSTLLGHLSPLGRREDGTLVLRSPFDSLVTLAPAPGLVALVSVLLGSTAFDGLTRGLFWKDLVASYGDTITGYLLLGTAGLLVAMVFVLVSYTAAVRSSRTYTVAPDDDEDDELVEATAGGPVKTSAGGPVEASAGGLVEASAHTRIKAPADGPEQGNLTGRFAHSLVPIVLGYTVAHYFTFALYEGQAGLLYATDPFGRGWDLLGLAGQQVNYTLVSPAAVALIQVGAIVTGHILGVIAAHDRAMDIYPPAKRTEGQLGLMMIMVAYTIGGISLVVGT